ncbi:uncharacterized protein PADG_04531 [Paracoccidioides brasiliensis Pb18]|uniref:MutL C-terminal dimerisation domain-containing protein n=1 Tax=Paracoccidioides brasiliensis (strain Pb18) TaxID=502780 RepID=C1GC09_PARBD|nr:uncharacterized protein PADG_04531 [Paracoccidioides brasiliensis Pb18]EEH48452.1 hypothetical protein PADG_04531 [Paracoccidioides brasiliensis Pb18]
MDVQQVPSIQPLPPDVVAQLKSSISISHLNGVVLELLKNSLDAGAETVSINVDFRRGGCVVEDDGHGIMPIEFLDGGKLAKLHHTSKFNSLGEVYGRKGLFLASLVSLALVTITSHHESDPTTNTLIYHRSKPISRLTPAPLHHELDSRDHGTRVTVTDLFGNLPVRVKHRALSLRTTQDLDREWNDLKSILTAVLLAFQKQVKVVMSDATKTRKLVIRAGSPNDERSPGTLKMSRIRPILMQAGYLSPGDFDYWVTASAHTSGIEVQAALSLQPAPTKQVQFISFGIHPVFSHSNANVLYCEVNSLFSLSSFGVIDGPPAITDELGELNLKDNDQPAEKDGSIRRKRCLGKGVNRWPMFYIRIDLQGHSKSVSDEDESLESRKTLQSVVDVLVTMIRQFLEDYHFRPRSRPNFKRNIRSKSPENQAERRLAKRPKTSAHPLATPIASSGVSRDMEGSEELLNPQIKLPNFTQSPSAQSHLKLRDFGSWSRIKSGRQTGFEDLWSGLPRGKVASIANNPKDGQLWHDKICSRSSPATPAPDVQYLGTPRNLRTGQDSTKPASLVGIGHQGLLDAGAENQDEQTEEIIQWTDPITKNSVLINGRTGQTLPPTNKMSAALRGKNDRTKLGFTDRHLYSRNPESHRNLWIDTFLKDWENPTFQQSDQPVVTKFNTSGLSFGGAVKSSLSGTGDSGFIPSSSRFSGRLTKQGLQSAQLIAQVDNKFLLLKLPTLGEPRNGNQQNLVLVDQHAADERCRVEQLFDDLFAPSAESASSPTCGVNLSTLPKPIVFKVSLQEGELLQSHSNYFATWGCCYTLSRSEKNYRTVTVIKLPTLIAERCRLEPKLVKDLLRGEIWDRKDYGRRCCTAGSQMLSKVPSEAGGLKEPPPKENVQPAAARHSWLERIGDCPKAIIDLLNSRACRSSVMFNDALSRDECENLVSRLARCAFPFQCAHGRPSMIPIVSFGSMSPTGDGCALETQSGFDYVGLNGDHCDKSTATDNNLLFMQAFKAWKPYII